MASKIKVDQIQTADGSGTIALQNQLSGMTTASLPTGSVLQVVNTVIDTFNSSTSSSYVASDILLSITPISTTSKILVKMNVWGASNKGAWATYRLYRGISGTYSHISAASATHSVATYGTEASGFMSSWYNPTYDNHENKAVMMSGEYLDSPSSTTAVTYKLYYRPRSGGTAYINRTDHSTGADHNSFGISSVTLMEIAG
jgi:hypothetical protein